MSGIFCGNIDYKVNNGVLQDFFQSYGFKTKSVTVIEMKGIAQVTLESEEEVEEAISKLKGKTLKGRPIRLEVSKPRHKR